MRGVKVIRIKRGCVRNVEGKVISQDYGYVIAILRWFKKPKYLRLRSGWYEKFSAGEPCDVELTNSLYQATEFRDESMNYLNKRLAEKVAKKIKEEPNKFILY